MTLAEKLELKAAMMPTPRVKARYLEYDLERLELRDLLEEAAKYIRHLELMYASAVAKVPHAIE